MSLVLCEVKPGLREEEASVAVRDVNGRAQRLRVDKEFVVKRDAIRITPAPALEAWSSTAVDLTLAPTLRRWNEPAGDAHMSFAPHDPNFDFQALTDQFAEEIVIPPEGYLLQPHA